MNGYTEDKTMEEMFLKRTGRLNRLRYFKRSLVVGVVSLVIAGIVSVPFMDDWGNVSTTGEILVDLILLAALVPAYFLTVRRLQDLNQDDTLANVSIAISALSIFSSSNNPMDMSFFDMILVFVSFGLELYFLFARGTQGENQYGADPLQ